MTSSMPFRGTLDQLIMNDNGLYEGNLVKYFQIIFTKAKNVNLPYHNFRHIMHITWLCHDACGFYGNKLNKREMRNLLIAAMFHDFDHRGVMGDDKQNISIAIQKLTEHILPEDHPYLKDVIYIIQTTEYPYNNSTDSLPISAQIIRDADLSQSLSPAWLQQVIFGLAAEWKMSPLDVLKKQADFHRNLKFYTDWGQKAWPQAEVKKKIEETTRLLQILEMKG